MRLLSLLILISPAAMAGEPDSDRDGYTVEQGDCDDTDPTVRPGLPEYCDAIDHDCNGKVRQGAVDAFLYYRDDDGDGFGRLMPPQQTRIGKCRDPGEGWSQLPGDCDDTDAAIHPGAVEQCDAIDHNCDGTTGNVVRLGSRDNCPSAFADTDPDEIESLSISVRTGEQSPGQQTDVELCVTETDCFSLSTYGYWARAEGRTDVFTFEGLHLHADEIDRIELRTTDLKRPWDLACVAMSADGQPLHCSQTPHSFAAGESTWTDPEGIHNSCTTCFDSALTAGPVLGSLSDDRAQIWFRTDSSRPVQLRVSTKPGKATSGKPLASYTASPARDFALQADLSGLAPDTDYYYSLAVDGQKHGPYTLHTPPEAGSASAFSFSMAACGTTGVQPAFEHIAALQTDLHLHLGDNIYVGGVQTAGFRSNYAAQRRAEPYRSFMSGTSNLAIWDDHDYGYNDRDGSMLGREQTLRAFTDYWPNRTHGISDLPGVFFTETRGDVEFYMLDGRFWRGASGSVLGPDQTSWLLAQLKQSTATFKILALGSQWTLRGGSADSWVPYATAREAFMQELADHDIQGLVLVSGDRHRSELRLLPPAPGGYPMPELSTSPVAKRKTSACVKDDPEVQFCYSGISFMWAEVDTTIDDPTLHVRVVDGAGKELSDWVIARSTLQSTRP